MGKRREHPSKALIEAAISRANFPVTPKRIKTPRILPENKPGPISFIVFGQPLPKGSKSGVVINGRVVLIEGKVGGKTKAERKRNQKRNESIKAWEVLIAEIATGVASRRTDAPWNFPVNVQARFFFECPKSREPGSLHDVVPDADKCFRLVGDALKKGGLVWDDSRIVSWNGSEKRYCPLGETPRVEITISPREEAQ